MSKTAFSGVGLESFGGGPPKLSKRDPKDPGLLGMVGAWALKKYQDSKRESHIDLNKPWYAQKADVPTQIVPPNSVSPYVNRNQGLIPEGNVDQVMPPNNTIPVQQPIAPAPQMPAQVAPVQPPSYVNRTQGLLPQSTFTGQNAVAPVQIHPVAKQIDDDWAK